MSRPAARASSSRIPGSIASWQHRPKVEARVANRAWVTLPAKAGQLVLFESWLRHEVAANATDAERVSVSFNYNWF